ncbi:MAG: T9SS type A sorting domain-containing protein [Chitinophagales bacterium]
MLDTTIDHYRDIIEERLALNKPEVIYIAPNPAQNYISLIGSDMDYLNSDIVSVEIFDITGNNVRTFNDVVSTTLFIGDIANGLYLIKINMLDNAGFIYKLLIQK